MLAVLRPKWCSLIIRELLHGPLGYRELATLLPALSDKVLSDRLAHLGRAGVLERERSRGFPPRVRYRLTARGQALRPAMIQLYQAGQALLPQPGDRHGQATSPR